MKTPVFVSFCLLIVSVLVSMHALVKGNAGPVDKLKEQLAIIEHDRSRADLQAQLLRVELNDYKQQVATLMPDVLKDKTDEANYSLRQLASVVGTSADMIAIERASGLFEKAKTSFREKDFEGSNRLLGRMLERFPDSAHAAEAEFLLAEGHYQRKEYSESAQVIEKMIEAYPENELTGFALLRLGHIFEVQDRLEDASDIYRSVLSNFKQPVLLKQAQISLKAVTL